MDTLQAVREAIRSVDAEMALLFRKRMEAVRAVALYKQAHGLPVYDPAQEQQVLQRNADLFEDADLRECYLAFLRATVAVSRDYQQQLLEKGGTPDEHGL